MLPNAKCYISGIQPLLWLLLCSHLLVFFLVFVIFLQTCLSINLENQINAGELICDPGKFLLRAIITSASKPLKVV